MNRGGRVQVKVKTKLGTVPEQQKPIVTKKGGAKVDLLKKQRVNQRTFKATKGMKADELLTALRDDFIEHGMDAYKQFRRMGVGLDLTDEDLQYG